MGNYFTFSITKCKRIFSPKWSSFPDRCTQPVILLSETNEELAVLEQMLALLPWLYAVLRLKFEKRPEWSIFLSYSGLQEY